MEISMIRNKILNYGFSNVDCSYIINLAKRFDESGIIDISANTIELNDVCADKCHEFSLLVKQDEEYADIDVRKQINDTTLLQTLLLIQEMDPEQLNITIFPKDDFENYYCKINILYYENVATVFYDQSICKKEFVKLLDKCFK